MWIISLELQTFYMERNNEVYTATGNQATEKREEMAGKTVEFRVAVRSGENQALPDNQDSQVLDLVETGKPHTCSKA